ncbi:unnamed protein product [Darwinula stevensoni]|uniref:Peptidylglycine alpha-amidating monooxygenase n=1 Tax=Darwinula stevensoni TaxID=69355 RepID=A0A7R9AEY7_9CRUS|nr:unnamed protein product [Darwinula stevensoni]CAG0902557.1 unnamed protein product [Darwinula stevensoni]
MGVKQKDKMLWVISMVLSMLMLVNGYPRISEHEIKTQKKNLTIDILMPGAHPSEEDSYICTSWLSEMEDTVYITKFEPLASADVVHHMLVFLCSDAKSPGTKWDCGHHQTCEESKIMFAWAKNAPPLTLPPDVGFRVTPGSYITVQIHYAKVFSSAEPPDSSGIRLHVSYEKPKNIAGIYLMVASDIRIPPNKEIVHSDVNCFSESTDAPIYVFGYRTHAHVLGKVITGYLYNATAHEFREFARGNPQWPQAFYPVSKPLKITSEDVIVARCTYSSVGRNRWTYVGMTHNDEMCNLYLMYYTDAIRGEPFFRCMDQQIALAKPIPADSDTPPPDNPNFEELAKGKNLGQVQAYTYAMENERGSESTSQAPSLLYNYYKEEPRQGRDFDNRNGYREVKGWANFGIELGQVTAVSLDPLGRVVLFHRGDRVWDGTTFDLRNRLRNANRGPISSDTILILQPSDGHLLESWGKDKFYLPHGLVIDQSGNYWLTDVGMHQIFKYSPKGDILLTLGEKLVPGGDRDHFCKPTDVAVLKDGTFFVSDGYCNRRVIKYSPGGQRIMEIGRAGSDAGGFLAGLFRNPGPTDFLIPHNLAMDHGRGILFVADREHGRIEAFTTNNMTAIGSISFPEAAGKVYAVDFLPQFGGLLFAVNGPNVFRPMKAFVIRPRDSKVLASFAPDKGSLAGPHDICVSPDGTSVYVAEIQSPQVWKFSLVSGMGKKSEDETPARPLRADERPISPSPEEMTNDAVKVSKFAVKEDTSQGIVLPAFLALLLLVVVLAVVIVYRKRSQHRKSVKAYTKTEKFAERHEGFRKLNTHDTDDDDSGDSDTEVFNRASTVRQ